MAEPGGEAQRQPLWFLLLLALAAAGGAVAYVPFLTVILPVRIADLTGTDSVEALAYVTFSGAITASLANIGFGWLSDRTGNRRGWIVCGVLLSGVLLMLVGQVRSVTELMIVVMAWQVGLNMVLAPLGAWAGDCVPDSQKGLLGGLLAFAPAFGGLSGAIVTIPGMASPDQRLTIVALFVAAMILPAIVFGTDRQRAQLMEPVGSQPREARPTRWDKSRKAIASMWTARLLVQIAEASLFAFLLFWLRSLSQGFTDSDAARVFGVVLWLAVPVALVLGRWSDRSEKPFLPLAIAAAVSCAGLLLMALFDDLQGALLAYVIFGIASMVFLSLHSGQTLRVLPKPQHRGRDLGIFNLTNTVPSLIMPWLTLALVPVFGFDGLFVLLAALSAAAAVLIFAITRQT